MLPGPLAHCRRQPAFGFPACPPQIRAPTDDGMEDNDFRRFRQEVFNSGIYEEVGLQGG